MALRACLKDITPLSSSCMHFTLTTSPPRRSLYLFSIYLFRSREAEEGLARGHADTFRSLNHHHGGSVPSLVPLNNVGLPVRLRQQPRRAQGLQAAR